MSEGGSSDGAKYSHLYTYSGANKAGMDGIDKEKQAQIIYEMSKDSAYFKRAAKLDAETDLKVQAMKQTLASFRGALEQRLRESVNDQCLALEQRRSFDRICCVLDMDMFFAAVEIRDQPHLKDLPVAVGGMSMISTANYVARKYGVRAAMPGFIARKLCPQLVFVRCNFQKYQEVSDQVKDIIREYDPHFSSHSLDEVYFDLTKAAKTIWCSRAGYGCAGNATLSTEHELSVDVDTADPADGVSAPQLPSSPQSAKREPVHPKVDPDGLTAEATQYLIRQHPYSLHESFSNVPPSQRPSIVTLRTIAVALLQEIRSRITAVTKGLTCSAGIANNFYLAKICADVNKPNGQYELPPNREDVLRFVSELPTRKVGGIGKVTERMLERLLDIRTMQQVRDCLPQLMHTCTPVLLQFLMRTSLGIGSEEGCAEEGGDEEDGAGGGGAGGKKRYLRKSLGCERTYSAKGISDPQDLYERLHKICQSVGEDMVAEGLHAKAVTLKLKNIDFELTTRIATSPTYFQSAEAIEALTRPMLDEALPMKVRLMGVSVSKFQHAEAAEADPKQRDILSFLKGKTSIPGIGSSSCTGASPPGRSAAQAAVDLRRDETVEERMDLENEDSEADIARESEVLDGGNGGNDVIEQANCSAAGTEPASSSSSGLLFKPVSAQQKYTCPVCNSEVSGSLMLFNTHLDRCLDIGNNNSTTCSSGSGASSTAKALPSSKPITKPSDPSKTLSTSISSSSSSGGGKGVRGAGNRSPAQAVTSSTSNKRAKQEPLVLGITDYYAVQR